MSKKNIWLWARNWRMTYCSSGFPNSCLWWEQSKTKGISISFCGFSIGNETARKRNEAKTKRLYEGLVEWYGETKQHGRETKQKRSGDIKAC